MDMDMLKFLNDLNNYCNKNKIFFSNLKINEQKLVIRNMLKSIAKGSHIKVR